MKCQSVRVVKKSFVLTLPVDVLKDVLLSSCVTHTHTLAQYVPLSTHTGENTSLYIINFCVSRSRKGSEYIGLLNNCYWSTICYYVTFTKEVTTTFEMRLKSATK